VSVLALAVDFGNTGAISASGNYVGGIFGHGRWNDTGSGSWVAKVTLENIHNTSNISGKQYVGGLFGHIFGETDASYMFECTSSGKVTGSRRYGNIAGKRENIVEK
jgi:hypothetical protein